FRDPHQGEPPSVAEKRKHPASITARTTSGEMQTRHGNPVSPAEPLGQANEPTRLMLDGSYRLVSERLARGRDADAIGIAACLKNRLIGVARRDDDSAPVHRGDVERLQRGLLAAVWVLRARGGGECFVG